MKTKNLIKKYAKTWEDLKDTKALSLESYMAGSLIKSLRKDFGKPCKEVDIECGVCKAYQLIAYLNWYIEINED